MKSTPFLMLMLAATGAASMFAQEPDGKYEQGRAVARISLLNGDVSMRRGDSGEVVAAALNGPVVADDRMLTTSSSRAEVQLDHANMLRVGPGSEVRFAGMDVKSFQVQIAVGTVTLRVLRQGDAQVEIQTPNVAMHPLAVGTYRFTVREDGTSDITVRSGQAEIGNDQGSERLNAGQTMNARGPASDPEYQIVPAIPLDSWDRWNEERDRYLQRSQSYQHVSPDVTGAEDLDQNGRWVDDATYGAVWAPTVGADWAPYQSGRWTWEDYYGWTWVSYDPWGWAPYHYGRWFHGSVGWCWYPGGFGRQYWSPALVGFFGWGGGVGVGFGFGNVGWVALAPYERFSPWWGRGVYGGFRNGELARNTSIVRNTNVSSIYRNARVNGGAIGMSASEFGRRGGQFSAVNHSQLQQAGMVHGVLPVSPDRSSLHMSNRNASGNFPQSHVNSFASRSRTTAVDRVSFSQQQRGMEQMSRSNFGAGNSGARSTGVASSHGWSSFGEPIHSGSGQNSRSSFAPGGNGSSFGGASTGGWQRFDNSRTGAGTTTPRSYTPGQSYNNGGGRPVQISPSMVQQRSNSYRPASSYQAPRSSGGSSYSAPRSAPSGGSRSSGGSGSHSSGGHR